MRHAHVSNASVEIPRALGCGQAAGAPSLAARLAGLLIAGYRRFVSPALPHACRFYPTCSAYAAEAIERYGFLRGVGRAILRVAKCNPLHPGGFDPVN